MSICVNKLIEIVATVNTTLLAQHLANCLFYVGQQKFLSGQFVVPVRTANEATWKCVMVDTWTLQFTHVSNRQKKRKTVVAVHLVKYFAKFISVWWKVSMTSKFHDKNCRRHDIVDNCFRNFSDINIAVKCQQHSIVLTYNMPQNLYILISLLQVFVCKIMQLFLLIFSVSLFIFVRDVV